MKSSNLFKTFFDSFRSESEYPTCTSTSVNISPLKELIQINRIQPVNLHCVRNLVYVDCCGVATPITYNLTCQSGADYTKMGFRKRSNAPYPMIPECKTHTHTDGQ